MNEYEYGPKYPPGEKVFIEEVGWCEIKTATWVENKWTYSVTQVDNDNSFTVDEWQILI